MAQALDIHTYADYGSYIHVHNKTSVDIGLDDSGVDEGRWAKGSPPNTIEAGSEGIIHLEDVFGKLTPAIPIVLDTFLESQDLA
jgi:hypothetical protein